MQIKERIKRLRKAKNLTMVELAKKTGIAQSTLSHVETGRNKPTADVIIKLAKTLRVTTDYLLGVNQSKRK